jgi:hypothetical protein
MIAKLREVMEITRDVDYLVVGDMNLYYLSWGRLGIRTNATLEELLGLADRIGL